MFAQRSTDHRGTPAAPGLVATLLEASVCAKLPAWDKVLTSAHEVSPKPIFFIYMQNAQALADSTGTLGRAYIVPDADVVRVLDELDFREKGG